MGIPLLALGVAFSALYVALVALSFNRPLWFDELLTYFIARADDYVQARAWDLNPPLLHLLARLALALGGDHAVLTRVPSALAFYGAAWSLFLFGARRFGWAFGLLPVLFLWYSPNLQYATEARPYALLCFFFATLLLLWDLAIERTRRRLLLAAVAACCFGLLSSHVLAPFSLLPFAAAELVRWRATRRTDVPLWLALFLPVLSSLLYLPLVNNFEKIQHYPEAFQASFHMGASYYGHTIVDVLPCVALAALAAWLSGRTQTIERRRSHAPLLALLLTACLIPAVLDAIMMRQHAPFWGRYAVTSAVAFYVLAGLVLSRIFGSSARRGIAAVIACSALLIAQRLLVPLYQLHRHPPPLNAALLTAIQPTLPMVVASGLTFVEMGHYENPQLVSRLVYLMDGDAAIRYAHATMFEDLNRYQSAFGLPGRVESLNAFTREHSHFLVFGTFNYPEDWLLRKLAADGARLQPIGQYQTPYKDKTLYEVYLR